MEKDDYELLDGRQEFLTLQAGDFCMVYPQDAHISACEQVGSTPLVRVVAKIRCME